MRIMLEEIRTAGVSVLRAVLVPCDGCPAMRAAGTEGAFAFGERTRRAGRGENESLLHALKALFGLAGGKDAAKP